jgi:hypothetical protein
MRLVRLTIATALLVSIFACKERQRPSHIPEPKAPSSESATSYAQPENGRMRVETADGMACFIVGFEPERPRIGELFKAHTQVLGPGCAGAAPDAPFTLDATMPDHAHGMVTKPVHAAGTSPGNWTTRGLKFHMPGYWKVDLVAGQHEATLHWHQDPIAK